MGFLEDLIRGAQQQADRMFAPKPQPRPAPTRPGPIQMAAPRGPVLQGPVEQAPVYMQQRAPQQRLQVVGGPARQPVPQRPAPIDIASFARTIANGITEAPRTFGEGLAYASPQTDQTRKVLQQSYDSQMNTIIAFNKQLKDPKLDPNKRQRIQTYLNAAIPEANKAQAGLTEYNNRVVAGTDPIKMGASVASMGIDVATAPIALGAIPLKAGAIQAAKQIGINSAKTAAMSAPGGALSPVINNGADARGQDIAMGALTGAAIGAAIPVGAYGIGKAGQGVGKVGKQAVDLHNSMTPAQRQAGFIAGPGAKGFKDAQAKGQVFDGVDGKQRFEVDDSGAKIKNIKGSTLGEVLDHPELFRNYPELQNVPVKMDARGGDLGYIQGGVLHMNPDNPSLGTLLHENQHLIQDREGFAGGGAASDFKTKSIPSKLKNTDFQRFMVKQQLRTKMKEAGVKAPHNVKNRDLSIAGFDNPLVRKEAQRVVPELLARYDELNAPLDKYQTAIGQYSRLAGEAEARAVEARMNMGMGERYVKPEGKAAYKSKMYRGYKEGEGNESIGKFYASNREEAEIYARQKGGIVEERDVEFQKPFVVKGDDLLDEIDRLENKIPALKKLHNTLHDGIDDEFDDALIQAEKIIIDHAKKNGHDGVVFESNGVAVDLSTAPAKPRSTFYDSLDVPKEDLIVRNGGGKAMSIDDDFIREEAKMYRTFDDMVDELADMIYQTNRGGAGSIIGRADDLGRGGMRISENPPFYQEFYKEFGKKPSKANVKEMVTDYLNGKENAVRWELGPELRDVADIVKKNTGEGIKLAPTPFDVPDTAQKATVAKLSLKRSLPKQEKVEPAINNFKITQKGGQKNVPVRLLNREGDLVTGTNVNPNIKAKEKRYSVNDAGELIEDKKGATSLFLDNDGKVKGFRVGTEYFDAKQLGDLSTVNGYGSTVASMRRNVERAFDAKTGAKVNEFLVDHQQAQATKLVNRQIEMKQGMQAIADDLGISFGIGRGQAKKVSAAIQDLGEKARTKADIEAEFGPEMANKIEAADNWFRTQYDSLLNEMNSTLEKFGYDPVPKRDNYYTHFQDETLWKKFGLRMQEIRDLTSPTMQDANPNGGRGTIDNKLAGLSETTTPNKAFNRFALQRKGDTHTSDAFKAFELYLNPTLNNIYMTPSIARGRVISRAIAQDANIAGKDANATIVQLREWSNNLAGKSNRLGDRQLADTMNGQKVLQVLGFAQRAAGQNTIVGNLATAVLQPVVLTQTAGKFGYKNTLLGMLQEMGGARSNMNQSGFLRRRYGDTMALTATKMDRARNVANKPLEIVERTSTEITWNAAHNDALSRGLTGKKAIMAADAETEKTVAGRAIGEKPELYRSKTAGPITMFQLEVNNYWQQIGKEMTKTQVAKTMVAAYGFNLLLQQITGREVGFNPIEAAIDTYKELEKDRPAGEKAVRIGQRWAGEAIDNIPIVGQLGTTLIGEENMTKITGEDSNTGRFGVASPIRNVIDNPWMLVSPFGGGQAKKTIEAIPVLTDGALKDKEGNTLVNVPQTPANIGKGLLFGKSAIPEINQYYNNLGKKKLDQSTVQNQSVSKAANQGMDGLTKEQQEMVSTAVGGRQAELRTQYIAENKAKMKVEEQKKNDKKDGKVTTASKKTEGDIKIADGLDKNLSSTLKKYDEMDETKRKEWFNKENDAEYKVAKAKFENDKKSGKLDQVSEYRRSTELKKLEVGSKYSKETRDLYKLGKAQLYNYVVNSPNGEKLAQELLEYDQKLVEAGLNPYNNALKFKNGLAPKTGGRKGSGSGRVRTAKARKGRATGKGSRGGKTGTAKGGKVAAPKMDSGNASAIRLAALGQKKSTGSSGFKKQLQVAGGIRKPGITAFKKGPKTTVNVRRTA